MNRQHRTAGNFRNVGARVDHNGDDGGAERVDTQVGECHRQGEVDEHDLHDNGGAADHFDENQCDVVCNPATVGAGETGDKTDNQPANQTQDRNPQGHFSAFKQEWNGRPDGAPVKLHDVFLYTVVKNEKRRPGKRQRHRALQT